MHPENNFIVSLFIHRWGSIIFMIILMVTITQLDFNIWLTLAILLLTIVQLFIVLSEDAGSEKRYTNSLMLFAVTLYAAFMIYKLTTYSVYKDIYEDINTTGYLYFYESTSDSNKLFFVDLNSRTVGLTIKLSSNEIKKYMSAYNPTIVKHTTNNKWYQYDDIEYNVKFDEVKNDK